MSAHPFPPALLGLSPIGLRIHTTDDGARIVSGRNRHGRLAGVTLPHGAHYGPMLRGLLRALETQTPPEGQIP